MKNKCPPRGPSEDFLGKENCVRGALNQVLDSLAEGSGAGLADPHLPQMTPTVEEHSGRKEGKQKVML